MTTLRDLRIVFRILVSIVADWPRGLARWVRSLFATEPKGTR